MPAQRPASGQSTERSLEVILGHRIALDLTVEQEKALARACGVARFTWNWALAEWNRQYEAGLKPSAKKLKLQFNAIKREHFPWIYESPKDANQQVFSFLGSAWSRFFKGLKEARKGKKLQADKPSFKKKGYHDSFYISNDKLSVEGPSVRLPVIGVVRMREELRFEGKVMAATVSREAERYFISFQVDTRVVPLPPAHKVTGIDLGLNAAVMGSDGKSFEAPKPLKANLRRLRRLSRRHSRKQKGSNNRKRSAKKLARLHARIKSIRRDWTHKVTSKLIGENQAICLEDLHVQGMLRNRKLSRAISDVGWYELRRQLEYKAALHGRALYFVDRFAPTSKLCSRCGFHKEKLSLKDRLFRCDRCGLEIDRDLNAAINIRTLGLRGSHACGQEGSGSGFGLSETSLVEAGTGPLGTHLCSQTG
jgi:putative transposase